MSSTSWSLHSGITLGNYKNSISKENEALNDLQHTKFPSDEARNVAVAGIYLQISRAEGKLGEYVKQAAYQQAAYTLGGRNGYEHATCFALFKIGTFDEVLAGCAKALAENSDDMETYYWRAESYIDHKRENDAVLDLERVANSRLNIRVLAAIDMAAIYLNRNENAAALNILNKYDFLFDEKKTSRDNIAIAFNNRCFAYMQLGDLHQALRDCNRSLDFGSLPDAYKKREEIEKRLQGLPI